MTWTIDSPLVIEAYNDWSPPQTLTDKEIRYLTDGIEINQHEAKNSQTRVVTPVTLKQVAEGTEVTSNGYAGIIRLPSGRAIELHPSMSARNFLWLMRYAHVLDPVSEPVSLNAFTTLYLKELRTLLDSGPHPGYRRDQSNSRRQQRQTTQLTYDTLLNRAVYHATRRLAAIADNDAVRRELRVRTRILQQYVSTDPISPVEIEAIDLSRSESAYAVIFPLVTSILRRQYLGRETRDQRDICFLVKMWKVFQKAVEQTFRAIEQRRDEITLQTQVVLHDPRFIDGDQFSIRPDFVFLDEDEMPVLVADTKWKPRENAAIYQIVTYQMIFNAPGLLLYPEESNVDQNHVVDGKHTLRLASLPTATEAISYEGFARVMEQTLERETDRLLDS
jgi:5-methylcytosine-specific restriction enzyme subunit McrC